MSKIVLLSLIHVLAIFADDPTSSSIGTDFVLAFFPHHSNSSTSLHITSQHPGHCVVGYEEEEHYQFTQTSMYVQVPGRRTTDVLIPENSRIVFGLEKQNHVVRVTCSVAVSLHASYIQNGFLASAMLILPTSSLSNQYFIPGTIFSNGFIAILPVSKGHNNVRLRLNTTSSVPSGCGSHHSRDYLTFTLQEREAFFFYENGCDFGGSFVEADNEVAVFTGSLRIQHDQIDYNDDITTYQVLPHHMWGKEFIISLPATVGNVVTRIMVSKDSTSVTRSSDEGFTETIGSLRKGQYVDHNLDNNTGFFYQSSDPISVTVGTYDSDGITYSIVPSTNIFLNKTLIPFFGNLDSTTYNQSLVLVTEEVHEGHMKLNDLKGYPGLTHPITQWQPNYKFSVMEWHHILNTKNAILTYSSPGGRFGGQMFGSYTPNSTVSVNIGYGLYTQSAKIQDYFNSRLNVSCDPHSWEITLKTNSLSLLFARLLLGGDPACRGITNGNDISFKYKLDLCGTSVETISDRTIYTNTLKEGKLQVYKVACALTDKPTELILGHHTGVISQPEVEIKLFRDSEFMNEIPSMGFIEAYIFVQVSVPQDMGLDMVVEYCFIGQHNLRRTIINKRCPADSTVTMLSTSGQMTRFSFTRLDQWSMGKTRVQCSVHLCVAGAMDCHRDCHPIPFIG